MSVKRYFSKSAWVILLWIETHPSIGHVIALRFAKTHARAEHGSAFLRQGPSRTICSPLRP
jgi:hypothetical protein